MLAVKTTLQKKLLRSEEHQCRLGITMNHDGVDLNERVIAGLFGKRKALLSKVH